MTGGAERAQKAPVVLLMGPTASGKTDVAMQLADRLPVQIIGVDSTQVYRGLDIGSAKPDAALLQRYPHRLVDIREPSEPYSVAEFIDDAKREIALARDAGRLPLLVGGTMLYFRALLEGLADLPATDRAIRATLEREAGQRGWPALHAELAEVDPALAGKLHPNHSQRIQRGLEVYRQTGVPLSQWQSRSGGRAGITGRYPLLQVALLPSDRTALHARIATRLESMRESGFLDEVRQLRARGDLDESLPAVRAVGYRQAWRYLAGEEAQWFEPALAATRQLAKRQMTWLRGWPDAVAIDPLAEPSAAAIAERLKVAIEAQY